MPDPKPAHQLVITLLDNGQIALQGPIENRILCSGLLTIAQDIVQQHHNKPREAKPNILAAPASILDHLN